jgi:SAM-dependent methyltransferase
MKSTACPLDEYVGTIDAYIATRPDLVGVRAYNHQMLDIFDSLRPLRGKSILDVGASPHGFALEWALRKEAASYTGIGLGIHEPVDVVRTHEEPTPSPARPSLAESFRRLTGAGRTSADALPARRLAAEYIGTLRNMDAETLDFESGQFDLIMSLSTFEHFFDGARVLREMHRVLRPGGSALISFQPVWTSSYGHHLHHVEPVAALIPPWAHLLWTSDSMRSNFEGRWPDGLPMSLDEAIEWIYRSNEVNRIDVVTIRKMFLESPFEIDWMTPLMDNESDDKRVIANYVGSVLPFSTEELMTLGYSLLAHKR